jgi:hypothetical protein
MRPPFRRREVAAGLALAMLAPAVAAASPSPKEPVVIAGKWMYRSYRNNPAPIGGDPQKAADNIFGEGVFTFATPTPTTLTGTFDMGGGLVLDLKGRIVTGADGVQTFEIAGLGRPGTATAGWEYDYHGSPAYMWPAGINQVPSLVGVVLRAKPHDGGKAGVTGSFIAVRQP